MLDMPIKLPDLVEYRLPRALAQFAGALRRIIEHAINAHRADYVAYLTIDQGWVDLRALDERVHDSFWEMNAQVAETDEPHRWQPLPAELTVMDCYCVHRGVEVDRRLHRTWLRRSFEERRRIFDGLGNAHDPLFDYPKTKPRLRRSR